jgi:hypothetical protein
VNKRQNVLSSNDWWWCHYDRDCIC